MKQSEARSYLEKAMHGLQRYRSISNEMGIGESWLSKELWPWVFGDKCPLPAISKMLDREKIVPMEFYNIMFILSRFAPEIKATVEIEQITQANDVSFEFPEPNSMWLVEGFSEE